MILSCFIQNRGFLGSFAVSIGLGVALLLAFGGCGGSDEPEVVSKRARIEIPADLVPGRPEPGVPTEPATEAAKAKPMGAALPTPVTETAKPESQAPGTKTTTVRAPEPPKPTATAKAEPVPTPVKKTSKPSVKTSTSGAWAINVASFTDRKNATDLEAGLEVAGYNPYITEFMKDGRKWYRVRVGFFRTRDEAVTTGGRIKSRFNVGSAWVVRPSAEEIEAHSGG